MSPPAATPSRHIYRTADDEPELRALADRYADASSRRDPSGVVVGTFTQDGGWRSPELRRHRRDEVLTVFVTTMPQDWTVFLQEVLSGVVARDRGEPGRATGRQFVHEIRQRSEGVELTMAAVDHDEYAGLDGVWCIDHRRYEPLLVRADDIATAFPFPADGPGTDVARRSVTGRRALR